VVHDENDEGSIRTFFGMPTEGMWIRNDAQRILRAIL
jgi:uncharacterized protein (DUF2141 family)